MAYVGQVRREHICRTIQHSPRPPPTQRPEREARCLIPANSYQRPNLLDDNEDTPPNSSILLHSRLAFRLVYYKHTALPGCLYLHRMTYVDLPVYPYLYVLLTKVRQSVFMEQPLPTIHYQVVFINKDLISHPRSTEIHTQGKQTIEISYYLVLLKGISLSGPPRDISPSDLVGQSQTPVGKTKGKKDL